MAKDFGEVKHVETILKPEKLLGNYGWETSYSEILRLRWFTLSVLIYLPEILLRCGFIAQYMVPKEIGEGNRSAVHDSR